MSSINCIISKLKASGNKDLAFEVLASEEPTKEMIDFYESRTKQHRDRVKKNIKRIIQEKKGIPAELLRERAETHDISKYSKDEYIPYVWLSWWYKENNSGREFVYPKYIKDKVNKATEHHIRTNKHHPEFYSNTKDMTKLDIAEMVADWASMSQELKNNLKEWVKDNIDKWGFSKDQVNLIYDFVSVFE